MRYQGVEPGSTGVDGALSFHGKWEKTASILGYAVSSECRERRFRDERSTMTNSRDLQEIRSIFVPILFPLFGIDGAMRDSQGRTRLEIVGVLRQI